jgi:hypothetical protein
MTVTEKSRVVMENPESVTGVTRLRAAVRDMWEELSASERTVAQYLANAAAAHAAAGARHDKPRSFGRVSFFPSATH